MEYKGYDIYACVTRPELFYINEQGETEEYYQDCAIDGDGYRLRYEVYKDGVWVFAGGSDFEIAKAWVDKVVAEAAEVAI